MPLQQKATVLDKIPVGQHSPGFWRRKKGCKHAEQVRGGLLAHFFPAGAHNQGRLAGQGGWCRAI